MDELIHQFLLQSGFPRAAIVTNVESVLEPLPTPAPDLILVDPDHAEPLAVLAVLDARTADDLDARALATGAAARELGDGVQSYVIRVDAEGPSEDEQVQFYRIANDGSLQRLSARTFPDIDSLRIARRLVDRRRGSSPTRQATRVELADVRVLQGLTTYFPAILLGLLAIGDGALRYALGLSIVALPDALLLLTSAVLLSLPVARSPRRSV